MKICLLTRYFSMEKKEGAGIGRVSKEILKGLLDRGYEVKTVSTEGNGLVSYFLYTALKVKWQIPKNYDIYHALTPMEGMWIPKEKSIVTFHDLFQIVHPDKVGGGMGYNPLKKMIGTNYFRWACERASEASRIVCVSEKTRNEVIKHLKVPGEKIKVIRSGISEDLEPRPKRDKVFRVGYLGMLDKRKRVNLLIEAFTKTNIDGELVIGGSGLDEKLLKTLAEREPRVKFLGAIPDEDLREFYNSLDLFVCPTWLEGYGLPIIEAMACKKPVVVLEDSIIPDEIKTRCIILPLPDLESSLTKWYDGSSFMLRERSLESNYKFAKSHNWDKCIEEYIKIYKEVLDGYP